MILNNNNGLLLMRHDHLHERDWRNDDCYKLIFSPYGQAEYQLSQGDISIGQNEFFIFNPNIDHKQLKATKEKFLVEIQPSLLQETAQQLGFNMVEPEFSLLSYRHAQIHQWTLFIRDFLIINKDSNPMSNQLFLENSLAQVSILMLQYGSGSHQNQFPKIISQQNINDVLDALKDSYQEDWTLDQMSVVAKMSKYQFAHFFKEEIGISPYSWLQLYRLFKSQQALISTNQTILTIALANGFSNVSSYNQLFKKVYNKTPTEFRFIHSN
ncbi:helix-turn-helix domain-containing protein [Paraliobacillus zengyii]|uniref:helix-turn-helix domain-containing protein n=1 Tax=Paraliobacillus zengyii TaxID=2213194 RepID=UPI000DD3F618|nr:AraC family transcriptional regulator [Paraliobacillus zengyii]